MYSSRRVKLAAMALANASVTMHEDGVAEAVVVVAAEVDGPPLVTVTVVVEPALHDEEPHPLAVTVVVLPAGQVVPETTVAVLVTVAEQEPEPEPEPQPEPEPEPPVAVDPPVAAT